MKQQASFNVLILTAILITLLISGAGYASSSGRAFEEQQTLFASTGASGDEFARRGLALDDDTVVVGAWLDDVAANTDQGSATVFVKDGEFWTEQGQIIADDGAADDLFGWTVAVDGDTALVGANTHDTGGNDNQGAAYVFVRDGGIWTQQAKLFADDGAASDLFGYAVALEGDTALVSAEGYNSFQGAVYVFTRSGTVWTQQTKLTASDGAANDNFGSQVALSGDTALVGASSDDVDANANQGAAYVFVGSGASWTEQQKLTANEGLADDQFGTAVSLDGDRALIGAWWHDIEANVNQGAAYIFERSGTTWTQQLQLTASDGGGSDYFGSTVALSGNVALIGAFADNSFQGSAYVFTGSADVWTEQTKLTASDGDILEFFGGSVAVQGNIAMIGAYGKSSEVVANPGAVYVFEDAELLPTPTPTLEPGTTDLVVNGGFENLDSENKPDVTPWTIKNASGDKGKCNKDKDNDGIPDKIFANTGNCAFQFKNVVGEAGKIQQTLNLSGIIPEVNDEILVSFFAQSKGSTTVKAKVVFKYSDDTKTKISVESSGADVYTEFTGSETLTSADVTKAKISFKSAQTSGKIYVDDVSLLHTATNLIALPKAQLRSNQ